MARKMRKFSEGGALGKYNRRMADIEKDFKKDSAGKSGRALEVLEAKRMQRTADAEDDRAKRTGADRTATRAAERAAESNLTKTRKYGAPKAVTTEAPAGKVTDTLGAITAPKSGLSTPAKKPVVKKAPVKAAATTPKRMGDQGFAYKKKDMPTTGQGVSTHYRYVRGGSNSGAAADGTAAKRLENKGLKTGDLKTGNKGTGTNRVAAAADPKDKSSAASRARAGAALSYLNPFSYISNNENYTKNQEAKYGKAKGGKIMKYAKGGSTPPQPSAADRARSKKHLDELKKLKPTDAEGKVVGSANRSEGRRYAAGGVTKEMPSSKGMGSLDMAKGGKAKAKPAAKGKGKPFAATKFGAALVKKSADTKGRAMPKFAKGGSIDGCAIKGKTKTSMVKMARGGAAKMRGRDSYGGAEFKKGGKTC
jgi:hypothetical protein